MTDLTGSYAACEAIARDEARSFFAAMRLLPAGLRPGVCALYAFCRRADDAVDGAGSIPEKRLALDAFRRELAAAWDGGDGRALWPAVLDTALRRKVPREEFETLLDGMAMDLEPRRYASFEELHAYCYRAAGVVGLMTLRATAEATAPAREAAVDLGIAMQLTNILRDLAEDRTRGRLYLPFDELAAHGCTEEDLFARPRPPAARRLMQFQVGRAEEYFARGRRLRALVPAGIRSFLGTLEGVYRHILAAALRSDHVRPPDACRPSSLRVGWIALRSVLDRGGMP